MTTGGGRISGRIAILGGELTIWGGEFTKRASSPLPRPLQSEKENRREHACSGVNSTFHPAIGQSNRVLHFPIPRRPSESRDVTPVVPLPVIRQKDWAPLSWEDHWMPPFPAIRQKDWAPLVTTRVLGHARR